MTDYIISNLINGGARIKTYRSGLIEQTPQEIFEITPEKFRHLEKIITELRQSTKGDSP